MNILPEILRQTQTPVVYHRQGPQFLLKLGDLSRRTATISTERSSAKAKTRLNINRYSIDRSDFEGRKTVNFSTIFYDFRNDPEFFCARGKKEKIESYHILIQERQKEIQYVKIKFEALRESEYIYRNQLKTLKDSFTTNLKEYQTFFLQQIKKSRQLLSGLRRETQSEIRAFKQDLKQQNQDLIVYCQQLKKMDAHFMRVKQNLQSI